MVIPVVISDARTVNDQSGIMISDLADGTNKSHLAVSRWIELNPKIKYLIAKVFYPFIRIRGMRCIDVFKPKGSRRCNR